MGGEVTPEAWLTECPRCARPAQLTRPWWASSWALECRACGFRRGAGALRGELVGVLSLAASVAGTVATLVVLRGCS